MFIRIKDVFSILWHRLWLVLLCALIGVGIGFSYTYFCVTPQYTASTTMYVYNSQRTSGNNVTSADLTASQKLVSTYIVIMKSNSFLDKVANALPEYNLTVSKLKTMVSADSISDTETLKVSVVSSDPVTAQVVANKIAELAPVQISQIVKVGGLEVIDNALRPSVPNWPVSRNSVLGGIVAAVIIIAIVLIRDFTDTTVRSESELTERFTIPVLGSVPDDGTFNGRRKR